MNFSQYLVYPGNRTLVVNIITEVPLKVNLDGGQLAGLSVFLQASTLATVPIRFEGVAFERLNEIFFVRENTILWEGMRYPNKRGPQFRNEVLILLYEFTGYFAKHITKSDVGPWKAYIHKYSDLKLEKSEVKFLLYGAVKSLFPVDPPLNEVADALIKDELKWYFFERDLRKVNSEMKASVINLISVRSFLASIILFIDREEFPLPFFAKADLIKSFFQSQFGNLNRKERKLNYKVDKFSVEFLGKNFFSEHIPSESLFFFDDVKAMVEEMILENRSNVKEITTEYFNQLNPFALLSHTLIYEELLEELPKIEWSNFFDRMVKYEEDLREWADLSFNEMAKFTAEQNFLRGAIPTLFSKVSKGQVDGFGLKRNFVTDFKGWEAIETPPGINQGLISKYFKGRNTQIFFVEKQSITESNVAKSEEYRFLAIFKIETIGFFLLRTDRLVLYLINWSDKGIKEFDVFYPDTEVKNTISTSVTAIKNLFEGDATLEPTHVFGKDLFKFPRDTKLTLDQQYYYALWYLDCRVNFLSTQGVSNLKVFFNNLDKYVTNVYYSERISNKKLGR